MEKSNKIVTIKKPKKCSNNAIQQQSDTIKETRQEIWKIVKTIVLSDTNLVSDEFLRSSMLNSKCCSILPNAMRTINIF